MKKLEGIDDKLPHPNPEATAEEKAKMQVYRDFFTSYCLNVAPARQAESVAQHKIYGLLCKTDSTLFMEDVEHSAILQRMETNPLQWIGHVHYHVCEKWRLAVTVDPAELAKVAS